MSFSYTEFLNDAKAASASTGVLPSVILAQWSKENTLQYGHWNFAGIGSTDSFPNEAAGLNGYISVLLQSNFAAVRSAVGWNAQCVALGASNWAAEHYDYADWIAAGSPSDPAAWTPAKPGIDLISLVNENNLTQYDGAQAQNAQTDAASATGALAALPKIPPPPAGLSSNVEVGDFYINGDTFDIDVTKAIVTAQLDLSMTTASTFTLTLHDPDQALINLPIFAQKSVVTFADNPALSFSLVSVEKGGSVLTVTFEAYVVAALRTANGAITTAAGQMTRTDFANYLVNQVAGATFVCPPAAWLYAQDDGYDRPTQEQISRGTAQAPLEDSWTCLQRLASEIDWVCFECYGTVTFAPYSWLASQAPVMTPAIGQSGIIDIDGTYDIGQPTGELTITATADTWVGVIGEAVALNNLGPLSSVNPTWLISEIARDDVEEPEITITVIQPQPQLPEPSTGGAAAAVGAGFANQGAQQTQAGTTAAAQALAYCTAQLGKPYVWSDDNPATGFDCSGLVYAAYNSVGIDITRSTVTQWAAAQAGTIASVPAGIKNLRPGDLVYFAGSDGTATAPGHVGIVNNVNLGTNDVVFIDAPYTGQVIRYDQFGYVAPGAQTGSAAGGGGLGEYFGALRPAP